jgi:catechol 2,3-dioxygenase-like lactoylglutathione lyase family enzyme
VIPEGGAFLAGLDGRRSTEVGLELDQLDLVVRDMEATLAFYRALGMDIPEEAVWRTASGAHHVDLKMSSGFTLHFDSAPLARVYDCGWKAHGCRDADRVDLPRPLARRGRPAPREAPRPAPPVRAAPYDTFWGARYAIVEDPDGNHVGIMSRSDPARRRAPPDL